MTRTELNTKRLDGKIAVITGGSSGIGLATAQRFVAEGAYVFVNDLRQSEFDAGVKHIGGNVTGVQGDVSSLKDLDRLYATVKAQKGRIDVLFANAGLLEFAPLGAITESHFDKIFNVNVKGLLFTVQKALPLFQDGGSIILNASAGASKGIEGFSVYSASKVAIRSFARTWTVDLKQRKIRVNAISPGPIDTPMLSGLVQREKNLMSAVPLERMGRPDEIAKVALSWRRMTAVLSPVSNCSSMGVGHKFEGTTTIPDRAPISLLLCSCGIMW